ncbi:MAG: polymer-forming cytoskeletal protein [Gammaproteobacteria bacterium]|nr:polymer-forming cytoskeletal protein [Gammaproteobacteria bacterium]
MFRKKNNFNSARIDTLIGQGTEINGDLVFSGGLHVDGTIKGNVNAAEGSDALLILSEFGQIEGDVKVPNMVLNGEIVGDVFGSNRVELAPKSRINGSVYYNLIEMAIGAEVNGGLVHETSENLAPKRLEDKSIPAGVEAKLATE